MKDEPKNPHSSPTVEKIKSVCCSGTNYPLVWEPTKNPSPNKPPDASAILDWFVLYPVPLISCSTPITTLNLSRCLCSKILLKIKSTEKMNKEKTEPYINIFFNPLFLNFPNKKENKTEIIKTIVTLFEPKIMVRKNKIMNPTKGSCKFMVKQN